MSTYAPADGRKVYNCQIRYLELVCDGLSVAEVAARFGVSEVCVQQHSIRAARFIGRVGFWKFYVGCFEELINARAYVRKRVAEYLARRVA